MIVLLCFFYPISAISSLILGIPTTFVNVIYRSLIAGIAAYIILISIIKFNFTLLKIALPMLFFMFFYLVRIFYDTLIEQIATTHSLLEIFSFYLGNICLPFLAIVLSHRCLNQEKLVKRSYFVLALSNIFILVAYLNQLNWDISISIFLFRASINANDMVLDIVNPITYGLYGGLLFVFSLGNLVLLNDKLTMKKNIILYFFVGLGLLNLILASSRGPLLYTFFSLLLLVYFYSVHSKKAIGFYLGNLTKIIVLIFSFVLIFDYLESNEIELGIIGRLLDTKTEIDNGVIDERQPLYNEAFSMFVEKPVFGNQINLKSKSYPHNILLELLMSTGLIGTTLFFFGFIFVILKIQKFKNHDSNIMLFACMFIIFIGLSFTSGSLYQSVESWCFIALLLSWNSSQPNFVQHRV